jgi:uncharacterized protein (DUF2235 family)
MSKNIIVCCDGTSNKLATDHTNVVRLFQLAEKNRSQIAFYDPGVGTMAAPDQKTAIGKRWSLVKGLALGDGLDENVFKAYRYLMNEYEQDDHVYLFGFSRGAFTARILAGMLAGVGLLHAGSENLLPYCWESYLKIPTTVDTSPGHDTLEIEKIKRGLETLRQNFTQHCPVEFLGVWDTVGSVGMYNWNQAFPLTFFNPGVKCVRHAVALDEKRAPFRSNVYLDKGELCPNGSPKVMNVWFPGVHADIGGGYPIADSGLAMGAFQWMVAEAQTIGMRINWASFELLMKACPPNPMAKLHESLTGAWKAVEYLPARRYNWDKHKTEWRHQPNKPRRMNVTKAYLHQSVLDRVTQDRSYWPAPFRKMTVDALKEQYPIVVDIQLEKSDREGTK